MFIVKKNTRIIIATLAIVISGIAAILGWTYLAQKTSAADMSKFDPGNIMSDAVMSNKDSMSVQQIQAFLNSKNACNNTNTYMASWYPHLQYTIRDGKFVCMAQDTFNGKSAAQIIWQVGQDYNINPQFLIVLLEKEQGLVTDTWPNHIQYRSATGFGCPDTAACDSRYFGLENQLVNAANLFRTVLNGGWSNYPVGWTYVQYNPNASCGGKVINIQNRATSALYRYTPYQPNQSAINAGYGLGDNCGAYGNRNTWALFTDWFGSATEHRWQPLTDPRIMSVKSNSHKYNVETEIPDELLLTSGQEIKFKSKTILKDGSSCLRTEVDTINKKPLCIKLENLEEISIVLTESIQYKAIDQYTCPVDIRRSKALCDDDKNLQVGQQLISSAKTKVQGIEYLIDTDKPDSNGNELGIRADRLRTSYKYTDIPTVQLKTLRMTNKISHIDTRMLDEPIQPETIVSISQKIIVGGITYYRTTQDKKANIDRVILADRLGPLFNDFVLPRNLKTTREVESKNPITNAICSTVQPNTTLFFSSKGLFNNQTYYRTGNMTSINSMCAIRADSLAEV